MPTGGITLFRVRGIRISVDYSWFLVLFLIIYLLSGFYRDVLGADDDAVGPYALALLSAILFFASILLHELGHAFVAIRNGIGIEGITLWMFGGVAVMERDSDTAATEFKVAIAGPIVTALIFIACLLAGMAIAGPDEFRDAALIENDTDTSGAIALISWLSSMNLLVLLFNLLPAFPLDGGRIARAIVWWRTGDRAKATRFAATLGRGFAYLMMAFGRLPHPERRPDQRSLADLRRVHPERLRAGRDGAVRGHRPDRGPLRQRRHGPPAGRDPRAPDDRAGPRRVLPALPLPVVPGDRRLLALHRRARRRHRARSRAGRVARPRPWARSSPETRAR